MKKIFVLLLLLLCTGLWAQTKPEVFLDKIQWLGQSAVTFKSDGKVFYIDPIGIDGETPPADVVLLTHPHPDHYNLDSTDVLVGPKTALIAPFVIDKGKKISVGQKMTFGKVEIEAVPAYNIVKAKFHPKASGFVGYLIRAEGVTVYIAGDTERIPEMKNFTADIAFLPLGRVYTMSGPAEAAEAAKDVQAKIAVPYHFGNAEGSLQDVQEFTELLRGTIKVVVKKIAP